MTHLCRWPLLLLALAPAWLRAADPITPVIPPPGAAAATAQPPQAQGAVPAGAAAGATTPPTDGAAPAATGTVDAGEPTPNPAEALPAPRLTGAWQAIEVVVFDRPLVGLEPKGELLSSNAPRTFPAALTSLDPPGTEGSVFYPSDPRDTACHLRFDMPPMPASERANQVPEAFTGLADDLPAEAAHAEPGDAAANEPAPGEAGGEPAPEVPPDPAAELRAALAEYEAGLVEQSLTWLPASANGLAAAARRLEQQGGYRVLFHRTWIQNLALRSPAPTVLVQSARDTSAAVLLEGTLRLQRGRGTRFDANLWYRPADADPADPAYIPINDSRRLGNGEVVYVDHPKLGIVVRAVEVGIPAPIVEAWQALAATPLQAPASPADAPVQAAPAAAPAPNGQAPAVSRPVE